MANNEVSNEIDPEDIDVDGNILCQKCEDFMPPKHKCIEDTTECSMCDRPIDDCTCVQEYDD